METDLDTKSLENSILTFVELLKTALLFDPLTHPSRYAKGQEFRVVPKGKFNASATEPAQPQPAPQYEFNLGVWYALLDGIGCLCADPRFFAEIETGAVKPQRFDAFKGLNRFQDYSSPSDKKILIYPDFPRADSVLRQKLADQQIEIAIKFVSLHEQAHVFAGHLSFVSQAGQTKLLEMDEEETPPVSYAATRRAIELQADAVAFQTLVQTCFGRIGELRKSEPRFFNVSSDVDWLIACVSAAVIVCCLFEIADSNRTSDPATRLHPSAKCRTLSVFQTFVSLLIDVVQTDEDFHRAMRRVLQNAATIFNVLNVKPLESAAMAWLWKPSSTAANCESVAELLELRENLRLLETELQQHQARVQQKLLD